jgi:hypothetical protein
MDGGRRAGREGRKFKFKDKDFPDDGMDAKAGSRRKRRGLNVG